ncbi:MAG TPA: aminotransferase class V-fold PLP-dependent enzyme, partial [Myxococcota bacterium]
MKTFGRANLDQWLLDPAVTYLNHGTVGATPKRVLARQQQLRDEMERNPARFLLRELSNSSNVSPGRERVREAAASVAEFLGAHGEDLGFVHNATHGVAAVLRSLAFAPGDEVLILEHAYGAVHFAVDATATAAGARVVTVALPFPLTSPADAIAALARAVTNKTKLAVVDHITSGSALLLPIRDIVRALRERGVPVLVDGAHVPGAIALDLVDIDADWYVGNLHKWMWTPRSCGFVWARKDRTRAVRGPVVSWGTMGGLAAELDWQGTLDPTPALAAPEAIAMMRELGVDDVRAWNHALAWRTGNALAQHFGTRVGGSKDVTGTMICVELPRRLGSTREDMVRVRDRLLAEHAIEIHLAPRAGSLWARISAQIYLADGDVMRLAPAVD